MGQLNADDNPLNMPTGRLELPPCYRLVPETSASTSSATWAFIQDLDNLSAKGDKCKHLKWKRNPLAAPEE